MRRLARSLEPTTPEGSADFIDRLVEIYWARIKLTGIGSEQLKTGKSELRVGVAACLAHIESTTPEEVHKVRSLLDDYDQRLGAAGVDRVLLEHPSRLLPGPLGPLQATIEALLGLPLFLVGVLTGGVPYAVARAMLHARTRANSGGWSLSTNTPVVLFVFAPYWTALLVLIGWQLSTQVTVAVALFLVPAGVFAVAFTRRMRSVVAHVGQRTTSWFRLEAVRDARAARDALVSELDRLRNRYRVEVHGWEPLPSAARRRSTRRAVLRLAGIGGTAIVATLFGFALLDQPIPDLPLGPSPWLETRSIDPVAAQRELLRDAQGVLLAAEQLDRMHAQMEVLYGEFQGQERDLLTQEDHDAMRALMVAFHDLRIVLLKTIWLYRGDNGEPIPEGDPLEEQAFVTAFAATALLVEKAWAIHEAFRDDAATQAQLNAADASWGLPAGTYSDIVNGLTNGAVMAEVQAAALSFDARVAAGELPGGDPWQELADRASRSRPVMDKAFDDIGRRRLNRTFRELVTQLQSPVTELTPIVSLAVSRFRFKERPPHRGLISPEQVEELRGRLRPGDILVERRNWYISNSLLPGFWPHAALYVGTPEELTALGVDGDSLAARHLEELGGANELGDRLVVLEAIGEGVIYTSLEQSVGEADAVAVLRPILSDADRRDALIRALSHRGKEYDFDFDFTTTDRLVCTELIFRTYDGILDLPEMRMIVGQPRLAAVDYVRMWAEGVESGSPQLELVEFLDFDEENQVAVPSDPETLVETLERTRFTFVR